MAYLPVRHSVMAYLPVRHPFGASPRICGFLSRAFCRSEVAAGADLRPVDRVVAAKRSQAVAKRSGWSSTPIPTGVGRRLRSASEAVWFGGDGTRESLDRTERDPRMPPMAEAAENGETAAGWVPGLGHRDVKLTESCARGCGHSPSLSPQRRRLETGTRAAWRRRHPRWTTRLSRRET
jgi:hypothetical protein